MVKSIDSVTGGMANALLAGVNPMYGLYTVLAATPVGALFTSSVYMNIDSTGALSAAAGYFLLIVPESDRPAALAVLTLLTGVFMLIAGLLKLGFLTRFISNAVLRGFITGIGVNIILGQLSGITGYDSSYHNKVAQAIDTFLHPGQWDYQILLVGLVTIAVVVVLDRTRLNKLSLLIALLVGTALVPVLNLTTVPLVSSLGDASQYFTAAGHARFFLCPADAGACFLTRHHRTGTKRGGQPGLSQPEWRVLQCLA